jgi:signal transduction histidine kinase
MRATTLFLIFVGGVVLLAGGLAAVALAGLERSKWWDARMQLAQQSYALHLELEANIYRLFKQNGDALLVGNRDGGASERDLRGAIAGNVAAIREVIAREIEMVGEEEIAELAALDAIEADIRAVTAALASLSASGEPFDAARQIERLADLLDRDIDLILDTRIRAARAGERDEVEEVMAEAAAFRARNARLVYGFVLSGMALLAAMLWQFDRQVRTPLLRLGDSLALLRNQQYGHPVRLGGGREFRALARVLQDMASGLAEREATREEQNRLLEATVAERTAEMQRLIEALEAGSESRKRLMADISHELRTPLTIILGEAEVTLRRSHLLDAEVSDALACIRDSARHTNQLVDDLLTVARHEAGQLRLDRREVDLRKIVRDAVALFPAPVAWVAPAEPVPGLVDEVRLRQSVLALLQNARRHGGPTIRIAVAETPARVTIAVEDDGPGMGPAEKAQAFERFFRGSNASGGATEGSGLGLPVVKSIVEAHGGDVHLDDPADGGLRVTLVIPRRPAVALSHDAVPRLRA